MSPAPEIGYQLGLAVLRGAVDGPGASKPAEAAAPEWMSWDARLSAWVAAGHRMSELRAWAAERGMPERSDPPDRLEADFHDTRTPRELQREAVDRWRAGGRSGSVVLPTGTGKTFAAILAIHEEGTGAVVVVPTRPLVHQWFVQLADAFGAHQVGAFYSDEKEIRPITVTTYRSAFGLLERWGARFDLLVFDEVHHLADDARGEATAWHDAARIAPAARRLGLTATYPDGRDRHVRRLVGPVAYRRTVDELSDEVLARYAIRRRWVSLAPDEHERYRTATELYETFVAGRGYRERYGDEWWPRFMSETRRSTAARAAHRAYLDRERVVEMAAAKIEEAERLLRLHPAETAVLFCGRAEAAEAVSRRFAIPMIVQDTPASERLRILQGLRSGDVRAVVAVQVLDEGWDVPGAKLGLVLGDTTRGSPRQHRQRLGRLLRRQGNAVASLYEIVVGESYELLASQKRRRGMTVREKGQIGLGF